MARTYKTRTVAIPLELYNDLKGLKQAERQYGSLNAYISQILRDRVDKSQDVKAVRVRRSGGENEQRKTA